MIRKIKKNISTLPDNPTRATTAERASTRWCQAFAFKTLLSVFLAIFIVCWYNHSFIPTEASKTPIPKPFRTEFDEWRIISWEWLCVETTAWVISGAVR